MKLAVTVWENRISPVFDSAKHLLLVTLDGKGFHVERTVALGDDPFAAIFRLQQQEGIELLLCGALCRRGEERLKKAVGLEVLPFLSGEVETILQHLAMDADPGVFAMPGCRRQCCCRRRQQGNCGKAGMVLAGPVYRGGGDEK
ncbi:MAG: hypothetical protein CSA11_12395 [Chloroflexi bacterium]|nr:MAG: hypothetical protein CSA11_12395 [Chloroflexota bacterium]